MRILIVCCWFEEEDFVKMLTGLGMGTDEIQEVVKCYIKPYTKKNNAKKQALQSMARC